MPRPRTVAILAAAGAAAAGAAALGGLVVRHRLGGGHAAAGGVLMNDAAGYDRHTRVLMASFFGPVAADVAAHVPAGGRVLEVGCGPGHLSLRLAGDHGLEVTGLDLDPAMIERARANAERRVDDSRASFVVGDVTALPFPDESFDAVVSTLSMHHWADPATGLAEVGRVLRPSGRALIWDMRPGGLPFHRDAPDPVEHARAANLRVVSAAPWRWPWRFSLAQRFEMTPQPRSLAGESSQGG